ncbi:hypothetical protein [Paenibacillus gallinarum]|uniref:DUF4878 domain-containing protein n=1 Tax=Paenibacillus gallinarum TaxID=2762232 RepID=A0ABR8SYL6_9BACL|nr:hypothetical protein [Paenibacillus gallinarum]MBD7968585.1 hypothetical protein [Paenibacillus gallinarum]
MKKQFGSLLLATAMLVGSAGMVGAEASPEAEAKEALTSYYEGLKALDPKTILNNSKSIAWPTRAEYETEIQSLATVEGYENVKVVDYTVLEFEKVSDIHFVATVDNEYANGRDFPAFELPVIQEDGEWLVVERGVTFVEKDDYAAEKASFAKSDSAAPAEEVVGEDEVYVATISSNLPDLFASIPENSVDLSSIQPLRDHRVV